jgi:hypothetical protein
MNELVIESCHEFNQASGFCISVITYLVAVSDTGTLMYKEMHFVVFVLPP